MGAHPAWVISLLVAHPLLNFFSSVKYFVQLQLWIFYICSPPILLLIQTFLTLATLVKLQGNFWNPSTLKQILCVYRMSVCLEWWASFTLITHYRTKLCPFWELTRSHQPTLDVFVKTSIIVVLCTLFVTPLLAFLQTLSLFHCPQLKISICFFLFAGVESRACVLQPSSQKPLQLGFVLDPSL